MGNIVTTEQVPLNLSADIADIKNRSTVPPNLVSDVQNLTNRVNTIATVPPNLVSDVQNLTNRVNTIATVPPNLSSRLSSLEASDATQTQRLAVLPTAFPTIPPNVTNLVNDVQNLTNRVNTIATVPPNLSSRLSSLEASDATQTQRLAGIPTAFPTVPPNVTNLANNLATFVPGDYAKKNEAMWCANGTCVLPSNVTNVAIGNNMNFVKGNNPSFPNDVCVVSNGRPLLCIDNVNNTIPANSQQRYVIPWTNGAAYKVGDHVIDGGRIFRALTAHTSSTTNKPPNTQNWAAVTIPMGATGGFTSGVVVNP